MKKLKKRFVALIMALTMAFSFSTVAFAAEPEENINMTVAKEQAELYAIEPMSARNPCAELTNTITGYKRNTYTFPITIYPNFRYLYFSCSSAGPISVKLYKDGVQVGRTEYSEKDSKAVLLPVAKSGTLYDNYWETGEYTIKITVRFDGPYAFTVCGFQNPVNV